MTQINKRGRETKLFPVPSRIFTITSIIGRGREYTISIFHFRLRGKCLFNLSFEGEKLYFIQKVEENVKKNR